MSTLEKVAAFHKALSEPTRLRIIEHLLSKRSCICICELVDVFKKDQSVLSRHIKVLEQAGIVKTRKEGRYLFCCLSAEQTAKKILEAPT